MNFLIKNHKIISILKQSKISLPAKSSKVF